MKSGTRIALALGVGYLLGRRRKMRLAVMIAAAGATGKAGGIVGQVLRRGSDALGAGEALGKIAPGLGGIADTVRGDLLDAGKAAAAAAVGRQVNALSESLHDRADSLRNPAQHAEGAEQSGGEREASERRGIAARGGEEHAPPGRGERTGPGGRDERGPDGRRPAARRTDEGESRRTTRPSDADGESGGESGSRRAEGGGEPRSRRGETDGGSRSRREEPDGGSRSRRAEGGGEPRRRREEPDGEPRGTTRPGGPRRSAAGSRAAADQEGRPRRQAREREESQEEHPRSGRSREPAGAGRSSGLSAQSPGRSPVRRTGR